MFRISVCGFRGCFWGESGEWESGCWWFVVRVCASVGLAGGAMGFIWIAGDYA